MAILSMPGLTKAGYRLLQVQEARSKVLLRLPPLLGIWLQEMFAFETESNLEKTKLYCSWYGEC